MNRFGGRSLDVGGMGRLLLGTLALIGALGATDAAADTLAFTPAGVPVDILFPNSYVNLGIVFMANTNFSVDALGFYDQSDLTGPETVGLYDSSGNLLASAIVSLSDSVVGGYLFQSITPVALTAGDTYTVDAYVGANDWSYGATAPNSAAEVTYEYHDYAYGGALSYPTQTINEAPSQKGTYYGPNFEIESTLPEPATLTLFGAGLLGLGVVRRRRA